MGRPIVYGPAGSTYVWSTRLALAEKGVAHELVEVGFGQHREAPHLSRHPFAKVPAFWRASRGAASVATSLRQNPGIRA